MIPLCDHAVPADYDRAEQVQVLASGFGNQVDSRRGVSHQGDFLGLRGDYCRGAGAALLDLGPPLRPVCATILGGSSAPLREGISGRPAQRGNRRVIEIGPLAGHRHLAAKLLPVGLRNGSIFRAVIQSAWLCNWETSGDRGPPCGAVVVNAQTLNYNKGLLERSRLKTAAAGTSPMPKALCIVGAVVAVLLLLTFAMDLAIEFPFGRASTLMDVSFIICAGILGYLSWATMREQV